MKGKLYLQQSVFLRPLSSQNIFICFCFSPKLITLGGSTAILCQRLLEGTRTERKTFISQ